MGPGFAVLLHLIILFVLSSIVAIISAAVTFIVSRKKRKTILAYCLPFVFFFTLYFSALSGSIIVSGVKNVDIGIGDTWSAPINDHCDIVMIDVTDIGYIQCNNDVLVDKIVELEQYSDTIIKGKTDEKFFVLNLNNHKVEYYLSEQELIENAGTDGHEFIKVADFEAKKYKQAAGTAITVVGVFSLLISIVISYLFGKMFIRSERATE